MAFSPNTLKEMIERDICLLQERDEENKVSEHPEEKILLCTTGAT
ncbi:Uncharacterised protein [Chlamydia trachomatis]|nr:Uncharacterised protein [Chlamydia trachomatis]